MPAKILKICDRGHKFYKSSDCPSCPICASEDKPESGFLSMLSTPARGALVHAAISTLTELSKHSEKEILNLHGVGPKTLPILRQALSDAGLAFAPPVKKSEP
ncbi:MAG TPA: RNA polymerase alpha subunit C-terminal domain-containing protein [Anaerolineales bacterium]|nr:RNA polymerase alpha subunit C-terminal domain-containing protein [Anaerolineales bacterium]